MLLGTSWEMPRHILQNSWGNPGTLPGKSCENLGGTWEHPGKLLGKPWNKSLENPWKIMITPMEHRGKIIGKSLETPGKIPGKLLG